MQHGIDLSNHQSGMDLAKVLKQTKTDFVICKATEGLTFVDKYCDRFMLTARQADKQVGFYHFARPERSSARAEADFFLKQTSGYFNKGIPVLDWESPGKSNVKWAKEWLDRVYSITGVKPVIYMSESVVNAYNWKAVADAGYGLWVARYRDYSIDRNLGTRHRAALGITESTDAVSLIVSEETGIMSVAQEGRLIRHQDANTGDLWKIMPFHDHLSTDQNICLPAVKETEYFRMPLFSSCRIGIHTKDPGFGKQSGCLFLDLLRTDRNTSDIA